jgi:hypothetical protein
MAKKKTKKTGQTFREVIRINRNKINDEMAEHSEYLYDIGLKIERIWEKKEALTNQLDDREASLSAAIRNKYKRSKIDVTETAIKQMVKSHEEYQELRDELSKVVKLYRLAKMKKEVLKEKGEMMVNISHNVREEKKKSNYNRT